MVRGMAASALLSQPDLPPCENSFDTLLSHEAYRERESAEWERYRACLRSERRRMVSGRTGDHAQTPH
jgi:hypothetical protein